MSGVRDRLTEGVNRARLKLELRRSLRPAAILALGMVLALGLVAYVLGQVGQGLTASTYEVRFAVDDAKGVVPGRQEVRISGVPAGTITALERVDGTAVLTARIEDRHGPLFADARAALRPSTALQDMYLDILDRGTAEAGEAEAERPLPKSRTETSVDIAEVLQVFEADTQARLHGLLRDLGGGLDGRGEELLVAFAELVPFLQALDRLSVQIAERTLRTRRMVSTTALLMDELGRRERELRALAGEGGKVFGELARSSAGLDATLRELPPALAMIEPSFTSLRSVLPDLDGALQALGPVAGRLPGGLEALRRLSARGTPAVEALHEPVRRLVPLTEELVPLSADLRRAVGELRPQTGSFDRVSGIAVDCEDAVNKFFQWTPSVFKYGDAQGPVGRAAALGGAQSVPDQPDPSTHAPESCAPGTPKRGGP